MAKGDDNKPAQGLVNRLAENSSEIMFLRIYRNKKR